MMKFNQGMYAKTRAKKNDPLSNLGKRTVCIVEKGVSITPSAPRHWADKDNFTGCLSGRNYPTPEEVACGR